MSESRPVETHPVGVVQDLGALQGLDGAETLPGPSNMAVVPVEVWEAMTSTTIESIISIATSLQGTIIVYDHWEDGYEPDILNPVQSSTEIYG